MKKFFIFIPIIILKISLTYANGEGVPNLPPAFEIENELQTEGEGNKSFWQKFKEFIGFGSEKKLPANSSALEKAFSQNSEDNNSPPLPITVDQNKGETGTRINNEDNGISDESFPDITLPFENTEDGPTNISLPANLNNDTDDNKNTLAENANEPVINPQENYDTINNTGENNIEGLTIPQLGPIEDAIKEDRTSTEKEINLSINSIEKAEKSITESATQLKEEDIRQLPAPEVTGAIEEERGRITLLDSAIEGGNSSQNSLPDEDAEKKVDEQKNNSETNLELASFSSKLPTESTPLPSTDPNKDNVLESKTITVIDNISPEGRSNTIPQPEINEAIILPSSKVQTESITPPVSDANKLDSIADNGAAGGGMNEDSVVSKYKKEFEAKKDLMQVPRIPQEELLIKDQFGPSANNAAQLDTNQLEFIDNEAQVLILPNDDVVLGVLTNEAKLEQIDFKSYVELFWSNYNELKEQEKRVEIKRYIDNYKGVAN